MKKILNLIGGELREPIGGKYLDNYDPSRGQVYSLVPDSDKQDVEAAIAAASRAFPAWSRTPVADRARILNRLADLLERDREVIARAESRDNGKPFQLAFTLDIPRSEANVRFFAAAITQFHGETYRSDSTALNYTESTPLGVIGCISPWNLPLYLLTWKIAPALAAGNCVVAKPSEITPMTAYLLSELAIEAGLPPGVLNIVHGLGPSVGEPLVMDSRVKAVSFTGSTATGRRIATSIATHFKRVSLEMGGKNANVVFADADLEKAVETSVRSSFANQGQICLCGSRILVEKKIYNQFRDRLVEKTRALRVGDPMRDDTDQGALVSRAHWEKVMACLAKARVEGGRVLCGGEAPSMSAEFAGGYFLQPTLIEGLGADAVTNQEEIFGPVATLIPFETEEEALRLANSTRYGLSASIWTSDVKRAHRFASGLEAGMVWVNTWMMRDLRTPFGGVKESGVGREGGMEALKFVTETKNICISL